MGQEFLATGEVKSYIPVRISYRIIELFSEGLYSSPTKAIEELVTNSFDAGASNVHVILSSELDADNAIIAVIDDGESMDEDGLRQHWLIGVSNKRKLPSTPKGRKQIGKFGIGKLATFVLGAKLTHICKRGNKYYATTMDYTSIPEGRQGGVELPDDKKSVDLPLRELTEEQAKECLSSLPMEADKPGYSALQLFGPTAPDSWTVAIISDLKDLARNIAKGRLSWIFRTAMPLRPDFRLFLNGDPQLPSKPNPLKTWVIGKDFSQLPAPAPDELKPVTFLDVPGDRPEEERFSLEDSQLGTITGYIEVYEQSLTDGKSDDIARSHGFFVYIHGRLINPDDSHFGIPANALRHGTFNRFRAVVNIDGLDKELRSTREALRNAGLNMRARDFLHGLFSFARNKLDALMEQRGPVAWATTRIQQSPGSLTRGPLLGLVESAVKGEVEPKLTTFPKNLKVDQAKEFLSKLEARAESETGLVVQIESANLPPDRGIATFNAENGTLVKNNLHPFIATYEEQLGEGLTSLLSMAEVLTEAYLYNLGLRDEQVRDIMGKRDELLKSFARSSVRRTALMIAQDLQDAATQQDRLEVEVVEAFNSLGFEAVRIGGNGKPDGVATASLGLRDGKVQQYKLSLEAKSKGDEGRVKAKTVGISTVARQRDDYDCQHAVVVAPDFSTTKGEEAAVLKEARDDKEKNKDTGKTITLLRISDLARLVRLAAVKPIGLDRLRELFSENVSPEEAANWIDSLETESAPEKEPYELILQVAWERQSTRRDQAVRFSSIVTVMELVHRIHITEQKVQEICWALRRIAPEFVTVRDDSVELTQRPDKVLEAAMRNLRQFPASEQKLSSLNL